MFFKRRNSSQSFQEGGLNSPNFVVDNLLPEDRRNIEELVSQEISIEQELVKQKAKVEDKLMRIQKSTGVTFPIFARIHNSLRQKFSWYYSWHLWPYYKLVHNLALLLYIFGIVGFSLNLFYHPNAVQAASTNYTFASPIVVQNPAGATSAAAFYGNDTITPSAPGTEIASAAYTSIKAANDSNNYVYTLADKPNVMFRYYLDPAITIANVTQIYMNHHGFSDNSRTIYIWNFTTFAWESLGSSTQKTTSASLVGAKDTNSTTVLDYIDANRYFYFRVACPVSGNTLTTDQAYATITYSVAPTTPSITAPSNNATAIIVNPVITSSPFGGTAPQTSTDWEIYDNVSAGAGNLVWSKAGDTVNLLSITVNSANGTFANALSGKNTLGYGTDYWARVRYTNAVGASSWSNLSKFATGPGCIWNNSSNDGLWNTATNWSCGRVPSVIDNIIFDGAVSNADATINTAAVGTSLTMKGTNLPNTGDVAYTGNIHSNANLTINSSDVYNGSFFLGSGTYNANATTVKISGSYSNDSGYLDAGTSTFEFTATVGSPTIASGGTALGHKFYNLTVSGSRQVILSTAAIEITNNLTNSGSSGGFNGNNQTVTIGNDAITTGGHFQFLGGTSNYYIGGNFSFTSGGYCNGSGTLYIAGNFYSTRNYGFGIKLDFTKSAGEQTLRTGGSLNTFNSLTHSGTGTLKVIDNPVVITNDFVQTAGSYDGGSVSQTFPTFTVSAGNYKATSNTTSVVSGFAVDPAVTFDANGGTFIFDMNKAFTSSGKTFNNITFQGGTVDCQLGRSTTTIMDSFTVMGNLYFKRAYCGQMATVTGSGSPKITVYGDLYSDSVNSSMEVTSPLAIDLYGNAIFDKSITFKAKLNFINQASNQTISQYNNNYIGESTSIWTIDKGSTSLLLNTDLKFQNSSSTVIIQNSGNFDLQNHALVGAYDPSSPSLTINNGVFLPGSGLVEFKDLNINGGTFNAPTTTIRIMGNYAKSGGIFNNNLGEIIFNPPGSAVQTLNSGGVGLENAFYKFTYNPVTPTGSKLQLISNALDIDGDFTNSAGTFEANGQNVTVAGNWLNSATFTAGSGTVFFDKASDTQTLNSGGVGIGKLFNNISHTGAGTLQLVTSGLDMNGDFTNSAGSFNANSQNITLAGSWTNSGTISMGASTLTFDALITNKTITSGGQSFGTVIFNGLTGSWQFNDAASIAANFTILNSEIAGYGVNFNNQTIDIGGMMLISGGKLTAGSSLIYVGGDWNRTSGTFVSNTSTVTFDASSTSRTINSSGQSYYNLSFNNSAGGWTLLDNTTVSGDFSIMAGNVAAGATTILVGGSWLNQSTFNEGTSTVKLTGPQTGSTVNNGDQKFYNFTIEGKDMIYYDNFDNTANWTATGKWHQESNSSCYYAGNYGEAYSTNCFGGYTNNENGTLISQSFILPSGAKNLYFYSKGDTEANCDYLRVAISLDNGSTWTELGKTAGNWAWTKQTIDISAYASMTAKLKFSFTSDGSVTKTGVAIDDVQIGELRVPVNSEYALTGSLNVTNNMTINSGKFNSGNNNIKVGTFAQAAGTFTAPGGVNTLTVDGSMTLSSGTFIHNSGTIIMDAASTGKTLTSGNATLNNLTFNGAGGGWQLQDNLSLAGNFTTSNSDSTGSGVDLNGKAVTALGNWAVNAGKVTAGGSTISVGGNWANGGGAFVPGTSTVNLTGTNSAIVSGNTTFNNLTINTSSYGAKTVNFHINSNQTVSGSINLSGAAGKILTLGIEGAAQGSGLWLLTLPGNYTSGDYIAVSDSDVTAPYKITPNASGHMTNNGNNPGWLFPHNPDLPSNLGPSTYADGVWQRNNTPTLTFNITDSDSSAQVQFLLQISPNSNFSSPSIEYTSALAAQGASSFTVGQAAGSGTYTTGSAGQTLADGTYYWRVKAINNLTTSSAYAEAGNSGVADIKIDTNLPTTDIYLNPTDPTGNNSYYKGSAPQISFTSLDASSGASTVYYRFGTTGNFSAYSGSPVTVPEAINTVYYYGTDLAGNSSSSSPFSREIKVDTISPALTATTSPVTPNGSNNYYTGTAPIIALTTIEAGSGLSSIQYKWDNNSYQLYSSPLTASEGTHTLYYYGVDNAGNSGSANPTSTLYNVEMTLPDVTLTANPVSPNGSNSYYKDNTPSITLTATNPSSGIASIKYHFNSNPDQTYSTSLTAPEGTNTITYYAVTNAGNTTTPITQTLKVDIVNSVVDIYLNPATPDGQNGYYKDSIPTISFDGSDSNSGLAAIYYRFGNSGQFSQYSAPLNAVEGTNTIYYYSTDNAGNQSSTFNREIKVDLTSPSAPTNLVATPGNTTISLSWVNPTDSDFAKVAIFRSTDPAFTPTVSDDKTINNKIGDTAFSDLQTFLDTDVPTNITYYYKVQAIDLADNYSIPSNVISAKADSDRPTTPDNLTLSNKTNLQNNITYINKKGLNLSWSASTDPNSGLKSYLLSGGTSSNGTDLLDRSEILVSSLSGANNPSSMINVQSDGTYYFRLEAKDNMNNISTPSAELKVVVDTVAPLFQGKLFIVDASDRSIPAFKALLSFAIPTDSLSGIDGYVISRDNTPLSPNNVTSLTDGIALNVTTSTASYLDSVLANQKYTYAIKALDLAKNEASLSSSGSIIEVPKETIGEGNLELSDIKATPSDLVGKTTQATITWKSTVPSTSLVQYGLDSQYNLKTDLDTGLNTSHTVILNELNFSTTYHFNVISRDKNGKEVTSSDFTFTTNNILKDQSVLDTIITSISGQVAKVRDLISLFSSNSVTAVSNTNSSLAKILNIQERAVPTATSTAAVSIAVASAAAAPIANAVTLFSLPEYLRAIIFSFASLITRKKKKNWGKVIEAGSDLPIAQAKVKLLKQDIPYPGAEPSYRLAETTYSDQDGNYAFIADPGRYIIEVEKDMYHISPVTIGAYRPGSVIEVSSEQESLVIPSIVLTLKTEETRKKFAYIKRIEAIEKVLIYISLVLLLFGTITVISALIKDSHDTKSLAIALIYPILWYINIKSLSKDSPFGNVEDAANRQGVPLALIRVMDKDAKHLVRTVITNENGKYKTLINKGTYKLLVAKAGYTQKDENLLSVEDKMNVVNQKIELKKEL